MSQMPLLSTTLQNPLNLVLWTNSPVLLHLVICCFLLDASLYLLIWYYIPSCLTSQTDLSVVVHLANTQITAVNIIVHVSFNIYVLYLGIDA